MEKASGSAKRVVAQLPSSQSAAGKRFPFIAGPAVAVDDSADCCSVIKMKICV